MKKSCRSAMRKLALNSLAILFLFVTSSVYAQGQGGGGIGELLDYLKALTKTTVKTVSELIYQVIPSTAQTITEQNLQSNSVMEVHDQTEKISNENLKKLFTLSSENIKNQYKTISQLSENLINIPKLTQKQKTGLSPGRMFGASPQAPDQNAENNFSFYMLIKPTGYQNEKESTYAKNFIESLNVLIQPTPFSENLISSFTIAEGFNAANKNLFFQSDAFKKFAAKLDAYNAIKSIAMTSLIQFYTERVRPSSGANLTEGTQQQSTQNSSSLLEIRNKASSWRLENPNWTKELATASPTALAREQALLQAEILYKLNAMQTELEQQKAANAALILMTLQNLQQSLVETEKELFTTLSNIQKLQKEDEAQRAGKTIEDINAEQKAKQKLLGK